MCYFDLHCSRHVQSSEDFLYEVRERYYDSILEYQILIFITRDMFIPRWCKNWTARLTRTVIKNAHFNKINIEQWNDVAKQHMAKLCNQSTNRLAKQDCVAYLNPDSPLSPLSASIMITLCVGRASKWVSHRTGESRHRKAPEIYLIWEDKIILPRLHTDIPHISSSVQAYFVRLNA